MIDVLIVGASGECELLIDHFSQNRIHRLIGVSDPQNDAPGILKAQAMGIPVTADYMEFLSEAGVIFDLTGNPEIRAGILSEKADGAEVFGGRGIQIILELLSEHQDTLKIQEEREEKYRRMFEIVQDVYFEISLTDEILELSPSVKDVSDYSREELIGRSAYILYFDRADREKLLAELSRDGKVFDYEIRLRNKNGTPVMCSITARLVPGAAGGLAIAGTMRDISRRVSDLAALRESEEKYRLLVTNAQEAIFVTQDGYLKFSNEQVAEILEYPLSEIPNIPFLRMVHPDDRDMAFTNHLNRLNNRPVPQEYQIRILTKTEKVRWVEISGVRIFWEGRPATLNFMLDITQRKKVEAQLQKSEQLYRSLVETISDFVFILNREGEFVYLNPAVESYTGYSKMEVLYQHFTKILAPEYSSLVMTMFRKGMAGHHSTPLHEVELVTKEGSRIPVEVNVSNILDEDGSITGRLGVARNISERKEAQAALIDSEKKLREIIQGSPIPVFVIDRDRRVTHWNTACEKLTGILEPEMAGTDNYWQAFYPKKKPLLVDMVIEGLSSDEISAKYQYSCEQSPLMEPAVQSEISLENFGPEKAEKVWFFTTAAPLKDSEGRIIGAMETLQDVTDRKLTEDTLRANNDAIRSLNVEIQKERDTAERANQSKTQFLANMSHEIRTPLNAIIGFSTILKDNNQDTTLQDYIETIHESSRVLLSLVEDILDYAKIEAEELLFESIDLDLELLIQSVVKIATDQCKEKPIKVIFEYAPDLPKAFIGDPTRIRQVLMNLVGNAVKFTEKGEVNLTVTEEKNWPETCTASGKMGLQFSVKDTGNGISKDKLDYIFNMFAQEDSSSTRKYGGSGLGLSITKALVQQMHGCIAVNSTVGKGSEFIVRLPLTRANPSIPQGTSSEKIGDTQSDCHTDLSNLRVLVAEDNQINQRVIQAVLKKMGVSVDMANDGIEALDKLRNNIYNIVLMDVQMPRMGGIEAASKIRSELQSEVPIIAITAATTKSDQEGCFSAGMNDFITKPVDRNVLKQKLIKWGGA